MSSWFASHGEHLIKTILNTAEEILCTMLEREVNPITAQIIVTPCTLVSTWMMLDRMSSHDKVAFKFRPEKEMILCQGYMQSEMSPKPT